MRPTSLNELDVFMKMGEWLEWLVSRGQEKGVRSLEKWVHIKLGFISYGENLESLSVIGNNCRVSIRGVL